MDLHNKNIILTGASSGIGLDLLRQLSPFNANIIAVARTIDKIGEVDAGVVTYPCDVSKRENIDQLFQFTVEKMGSIDIFIANAGFAYYEQIRQADWEHIEKIYSTNVFSGIYSAEKMKELNADRPYRVVMTASAMSFLTLPGYALYASTKAALRGFAAGYRKELVTGQKLQLVYPIATKTKFFQQQGKDAPVPWPSQSSEKVAKAIIKGMKNGTNSIFPSRLFWWLNVLNGYLPFIHKLIFMIEEKNFDRWLKPSGQV